jgi:hypothetical protein
VRNVRGPEVRFDLLALTIHFGFLDLEADEASNAAAIAKACVCDRFFTRWTADGMRAVAR